MSLATPLAHLQVLSRDSDQVVDGREQQVEETQGQERDVHVAADTEVERT